MRMGVGRWCRVRSRLLRVDGGEVKKIRLRGEDGLWWIELRIASLDLPGC